MASRVPRQPRLSRLLQTAVRAVYGRYVPVTSSLRLHLALRRDVEPARTTPPTGRIVVLAPHIDDEVFGCGGTIALAADAGARVTFVYVTDSSKRSEPASSASPRHDSEAETPDVARTSERKDAARRAAAVLGVTDLVFLDQPQGMLSVTDAVVVTLADAVARRSPSAVFLPFLTDPDRDHWITNRLFVEAAVRAHLARSIVCWGYEVGTPVIANAVVDITAAADRKRLAMHDVAGERSELDYPRAMLGLNAYRSLHGGRAQGLAEAFHVADLGVYRRLFEMVAVGLGRGAAA
jgi:LmbE family N-acetylglucosaminyl deacetylase